MNSDDLDAFHVHITSRTFAAKRGRRSEARFWLAVLALAGVVMLVVVAAAFFLLPSG